MTSPEEVENMNLSVFAKANLVVEVASKAFGETVCFVSDDRAAERAPEGMVVYLADELAIVERSGLSKDSFYVIHKLKKAFNGTICDPDVLRKLELEAKARSAPRKKVRADPSSLAAAKRLEFTVKMGL